jgi:ADP-ribose pyrophosphatase YjhB (NUDIX family)
MSDNKSNYLHSVNTNGVVFKNGKVLVSQRSWEEEHMPGRWTIPGGKVERTEGFVFDILQKTLKREIREETGVKIEDNVQLVTNNTYTRENGDHVVAVIFKCYYKSGKARPLEDTIDCKWVSLNEVKDMDFPPNVKEYILKAAVINS